MANLPDTVKKIITCMVAYAVTHGHLSLGWTT